MSWIKSSDYLPEDYSGEYKYWVTDGEIVCLARQFKVSENRWIGKDHGHELEDVTHWTFAIIPEPPKDLK